MDCSTTQDFYELNRARLRESRQVVGQASSIKQLIECGRGDPVTGRRKGYLVGADNVQGGFFFKTKSIDECENHCDREDDCKFYQLEEAKEECLLKATDGTFKCNQDYEVGPKNRPSDQSAFTAGKTCTKPCSGESCKNVAKMLGHLIDFSIDPCRDFFAFSCSSKTRGSLPPVPPRRIEKFQDLIMNPPTGFEYVKNFYLSCTDRWPKNTTKEVFSSCIKDDGVCTLEEVKQFGFIYGFFFKIAQAFMKEYSFPASTPDWEKTSAGKDFTWWDFSADVLNKYYLLAACNLLGAIPGDDRADFFRSNVFLAPLVDSVATRDYDEKHTIYMVPLYIPESIVNCDVISCALYKKLMTGVFTSVGVTPGAQMDKDIEMVLEMEQDLGQITVEEGWRSGVRYTETEAHWTKKDFEKHGEKVTLAELYTEMPSVEWKTYLAEAFSKNTDFKITRSTEVWIPSKAMLRLLNTYLKETTSKRDQANFLMWRMIYQLGVDYLVTGFQANDDQMDVFSARFGNLKTRGDHCEAQIKILFPEVKNDMIIAKYIDSSQKQGIKEVFDKVGKEYLKIIDEQSWMSDKTKRKAKTKVKAMKLNVGVLSPKTPTYENLKRGIGKDAYFPNIFAIGNYRREAQVQALGKELKEHRPSIIQDEESWNAYYRPAYNDFAILAGLIDGFFGIGLKFDIPKALLYGGFRALGHEMMHGFDSRGRLNDEDGFRLDWWTKKENDEYEIRSQCLVGNPSIKKLAHLCVLD